MDMLLVRGRFEVSGLSIGTIKNCEPDDMGKEDIRLLSIGAFVERKLSGRDIFSTKKGFHFHSRDI